MSRLTILGGVIFARVLSGLMLFGTAAWGQASTHTSTPLSSSPDVYLITIDTLRADHVGCYGYKQVETPALDALAADGVRFTHAFTHSPITNTSHATILTGLLPSVHGVTDFGVPLSPQHATAAELLKKQGYQTAAFIAAVILDSTKLAPGLDHGFDFYDNFSPIEHNIDVGANSKERWDRVRRRGMVVVDHAEAWFDKHRTGPHFVWVHLYDPHDPYDPPPPFSEKYKYHLYDGGIAYADSVVARWIAFLKKAGVYDNAIVIVSADHGEGLGEHGEETHGFLLYDSTLHIPLILKMPLKTAGTGHRGTVIDDQVRTTDILPTILSATGVAIPGELNGESLLPLIEQTTSAQAPSNRALFAETDYPLRWGWAPLRALRTPDTKWIEAPRPELYDLQADPKELKNLYAPDSASSKVHSTQAGMQAEMAKWKAKLPPQSNSLRPTEIENLPDPKDKTEVQNQIHQAVLAGGAGLTAKSREYLEKALQIDPDSPTTLRQLGDLELSAQDYPKAATYLKRAVQLRPGDFTAAFELGQALEKTGDVHGARDALEASLKLSPTQMDGRLLLGRVYLQLKDSGNAEDQFEAALLVESGNEEGRLGLAEARIIKGDFAAALPDLESVTKSDPKNAVAWRLLAQAYQGLHRAVDAVQANQKAAALEKK